MKIICKNKQEFFDLLDASKTIHDSHDMNSNDVLNTLGHMYLITQHSNKILEEWFEGSLITIDGTSLVTAVQEYVNQKICESKELNE